MTVTHEALKFGIKVVKYNRGLPIAGYKGPFKCYVKQMGWGVSDFPGKALRRCNVQCH